eukprot:Colp12_sorted_trinity150504_noHs@33810
MACQGKTAKQASLKVTLVRTVSVVALTTQAGQIARAASIVDANVVRRRQITACNVGRADPAVPCQLPPTSPTPGLRNTVAASAIGTPRALTALVARTADASAGLRLLPGVCRVGRGNIAPACLNRNASPGKERPWLLGMCSL